MNPYFMYLLFCKDRDTKCYFILFAKVAIKYLLTPSP